MLDLIKLNLARLRGDLHDVKCNLILLGFILVWLKKILSQLLDGVLTKAEEEALKAEGAKLGALTGCPVPPDPPAAGAAG